MIHYRRVGSGDKLTNQRGKGSDHVDNDVCCVATITTTTAVRDHLAESDVEGWKGNTAHRRADSDRGRELPGRTRRRLMGKVVLIIAVAGTLILVMAAERLASGPFDDGGIVKTTWTETVAGCTGTEDGFVYGGETGKVLTFVRRGRGERRRGERDRSDRGFLGHSGSGVNASWAASDSPTLPEVLKWFWRLKHDRGVLAYKVSKLEERRDVGSESGWEVAFASNVGRNKPFPAAGPAEVAWDPSSFNFYKASPSEFLLSYTPSFRHERERLSIEERRRALGEGEAGQQVEAHVMERAGAPMRKANTEQVGVLSNAASETISKALERATLEASSSVGCREASTASPPQDAVLVNIRPVGSVSLLLTPGYPNSHNQKATAESLAVALDFAEALRVDPGFRLGFNSAGSSASVNHLHFQCWFFDAGPRGLAIEASKTKFAATVPLHPFGAREDPLEVHTLVGYPIRALVFHTSGMDLEAVGQVMERCVNFLVEDNTPHTIVFSTGRAFLLPRQHLEEPPFAVVPGFPEVSGEVIVTKEEDFRTITADQIFNWWRDKIGVSAEYFDRVTHGCLK